MNVLGALDAFRAEVPIRTVETLMANAIDELLTSITDSMMANIPASIAKDIRQCRQVSFRSGTLESMAWVVAVLCTDVAFHTEIVIVTGSTGDKLFLGEDLDAGVAGTSRLLSFKDAGFRVCGKGTGYFLFCLGLSLRPNPLRRAIDDHSILNETFHHPVTGARTVDASINT